MKPEKKEAPGLCEINTETMKATIAILHHGKYKQAKKLKSKIRSKDAINFIVEGIKILSCVPGLFYIFNKLRSTVSFQQSIKQHRPFHSLIISLG